MQMQNIQINIPIAWEYVRLVRQEVEVALAAQSEELRSAAVMVASELVENAIKYGVSIPALQWARFRCEISAEHILIEVKNGLTDDKALATLRQIVSQMTSVAACEQLYVARLHALLGNPAEANRLGLYRIGYEGKFELEYSYADEILQMTARRRLP